jgi:hypothetical protein
VDTRPPVTPVMSSASPQTTMSFAPIDRGLIRPCKASTFRFKDDRSFPTIRCHLSRRFRTQVTVQSGCDSLLTL